LTQRPALWVSRLVMAVLVMYCCSPWTKPIEKHVL
jgi:hypothetical protein